MEELKNPLREQMEAGDQDLRDVGVNIWDGTMHGANPETMEAVKTELENGDPEWLREFEDEEQEKKMEKAVRVAGRALILALADTALAMMILGGKIDLAYGLLFLAGTSAFLGAKVENARV